MAFNELMAIMPHLQQLFPILSTTAMVAAFDVAFLLGIFQLGLFFFI
jgi:hypothetical protein